MDNIRCQYQPQIIVELQKQLLKKHTKPSFRHTVQLMNVHHSCDLYFSLSNLITHYILSWCKTDLHHKMQIVNKFLIRTARVASLLHIEREREREREREIFIIAKLVSTGQSLVGITPVLVTLLWLITTLRFSSSMLDAIHLSKLCISGDLVLLLQFYFTLNRNLLPVFTQCNVFNQRLLVSL